MTEIRLEISATLRPARRCSTPPSAAARFEKTCERLREGRLPAEACRSSPTSAGRLVGTVRLWNVSAGPGRAGLAARPARGRWPMRSQGLGGRMMRAALEPRRRLGHKAVAAGRRRALLRALRLLGRS